MLETEATDESKLKGKSRGTSPFAVLRVRNFLLLCIGQGISLLGDQFHLVALPWLVLQLTGNGLAMGTVLATAGIPRALFMLVGGALADRFSPRAVMLGSTLLRFGLVASLTVLVLTESIELWMLYFIALIFGLADAFFYPAENAIVPQLLDRELLQTGNALVQGTALISVFVGPVLAGILISLFGSGGTQIDGSAVVRPDLQGIGIAFGFDAFTFVISAITLWMMRFSGSKEQMRQIERAASVVSSIREGLVTVWNDATLRTSFIIIAAISLLFNGPFVVGIPVLANSRFPEGVAAFGIIFSSYGGGSLLGTGLAVALPKPSSQRLGSIFLAVISVLGFGLVLLGIVSSIGVAALVSFAIGAANSYVVILFTTWLQRRTPPSMLGRMMSVLMLAAVGLNPVSSALAGALIDLNATALLVCAGTLVTVIVLLSALNPNMRSMGATPE